MNLNRLFFSNFEKYLYEKNVQQWKHVIHPCFVIHPWGFLMENTSLHFNLLTLSIFFLIRAAAEFQLQLHPGVLNGW